MKTPTEFAEEETGKSIIPVEYAEHLSYILKSYALHVLEEVEVLAEARLTPHSNQRYVLAQYEKAIDQIRKELEG